MSDYLQPHGLEPRDPLEHARPPCPSPTPRVYSNSCPLSRWCHTTISSFVIPFSCFRTFLVSGSFPRSQFFASGGQIIGASASVLSKNIQDWFPLRLTDLISLKSKGLSRVFSPPQFKILGRSALFMVQLSHQYMTTGKNKALNRWTFISKVMSLLLNMLSRLVIAFLLRSKRLLISWLQSPSVVILEPKKNELCHYFHCFPIY